MSANLVLSQFMEALAGQRRKRGLNASSVSLPGIWSDTLSSDASTEEYFSSITESDVSSLLNEATVWGVDARPSPQLITALKRTAPSPSKTSNWRAKPKFSHLISRSASSAASANQQGGQSLKQELEMSKSPEEASKILQRHFVRHLEVMLNLGPDSVRDDTDLVGIGIDSLMASDLRSWFLVELEVDVPVLKILGGSTVQECKFDMPPSCPPEY
jgi:aryl carrier-like protein